MFRYQRRVDFCDTDVAGIVHFSNYLRYMEAAEVAFLKSRGLNVHFEWQGAPLAFPRVSAKCDYLSPARFDDLLDIDVRVEKLGSKSFTYAFDISRDGTPIAKGTLTSVCCRVEGGFESIEIPTEIREAIQGR